MPNNFAKECFVISPIGEDGSEERRRADKVLRYLISPPVRDSGYEPVRADMISEPGIITSQIIEHILESSIVIADMTGHNPNVFYELAIRQTIDKPVLLLMQKGNKLPFDLASNRVIFFDISDIESVELAKIELKEQLSSVERNPELTDSPVTIVRRIQLVKQSDDADQRIVGQTLEKILSKLSNIESKVNKPSSHLPPALVRDVDEIYNVINDIRALYSFDESMDNEIENAVERLRKVRNYMRRRTIKEEPSKLDDENA